MDTMRDIDRQYDLKRKYEAQEELRRRTWGPDYY
jgi:hypothetical protein